MFSIIFIGLMVGLCATIIFEFILKSNKWLWHRYYQHHFVIAGYHVHHSVYGLLFILAGIILYFYQGFNTALFYIMIGFGIITQHTLSAKGRVVFIEKWYP